MTTLSYVPLASCLCKGSFRSRECRGECENHQRKNDKHQRKFPLPLPLSLSLNGPLKITTINDSIFSRKWIWFGLSVVEYHLKRHVHPSLQRPDSELSLAQQIPGDALLKLVAERAHNRNWNLLGSKLTVAAEDIEQIETNNPDDPVAKVTNSLVRSVF